MQELKVKFDHGLGDCSLFLRVLQLYKNHGYKIEVERDDNKDALFQMAGYPRCHNAQRHPWIYFDHFNEPQMNDRIANKTGRNLNVRPMPDLGDINKLWDHLCAIQVKLNVPQESIDKMCKLTEDLPTPLVLYHAVGSNWKERKNFTNEVQSEFYRLCLREGYGLIVMDWDRRTSPIKHGAVRVLDRDFGRLNLFDTAALFMLADAGVFTDSGPYHMADFFELPQLYACGGDLRGDCVGLPRKQAAILVPGAGDDTDITHQRRAKWNMIQFDGKVPSAELIFKHLKRMINPRYRVSAGRDLVLQHLLFDKINLQSTNLSNVVSRGITFDYLFYHMKEFSVIVETGSCRSKNDWGAGESTLLFGLVADQMACKVISVDNDENHINFAKEYCKGLNIKFIQSDSIQFLQNYSGEPINLLYLDSMDADIRGSDSHCLDECKAALPKLASNATIAIDDTVFDDGKWQGKGSLAVDWLKTEGFKVMCAAYGVILQRGA